ncbi:hypothetical protein [Bosea sp. NBC_00550]|uniref:hypothetical protein n=1 Tax=Bosea sp. NBC_00550 TaxID=2969621 RepID=UPI002231BE2E|nr:hypothetical protein [Bosea sp. NBC_00550]UZF93020.1 hypothetical protein NWE53_02040 [Bosea sp. NBC_00550]
MSSAYRVRLVLLAILALVEIAIIAVCLNAGWSLATAHGGGLLVATPIILIALVECLRVPLASWAMHLKWTGRLAAFIVLGFIAVGTFEGLSLAVEQMMNARISFITKAREEHDVAKQSLESLTSNDARNSERLAKLDKEIIAAGKTLTELKDTEVPKLPDTRPCTLKTGKPGLCRNPGAAEANVRAMEQHAELLTKAGQAKAELEAQRAVLTKGGNGNSDKIAMADHAVSKAEADLTRELKESPMHRLAANFFGISVQKMQEADFERFKGYAVYGVAGALSLATMVISMIAHAAPKGKDGRIAKALRAYIARKRRPLYRDRTIEVPGPEVTVEVEKPVPGPERKVLEYVYVPYDHATGRRIRDDHTLGEVIHPNQPHLKPVAGGRL